VTSIDWFQQRRAVTALTVTNSHSIGINIQGEQPQRQFKQEAGTGLIFIAPKVSQDNIHHEYMCTYDEGIVGDRIMERFSDKTALVTGAGSGIGRAIAQRLADEGADVVVSDVNEERGEAVVASIEDDGGSATFVSANVANPEEVQQLVETTVDTYGGLDIAVNNAGILTGLEDITDIEEDDWERLIDVNLKGVWAGMKAELPVMEEQGGGVIVNTASEAGFVGMGGLGNYVASKHGVVGLTKTAALEYADRSVRVNAIAPGPTETNIQETMAGGSDPRELPFDTSTMSDVPMGRQADPKEMAGVVAFLCSEDASFVTGVTIPVDGGQAAD
jgi:NAD(P)-dependent dehydrogenase (short-subunit alcohol dehydrogenase family)